jgi:DNA-binding NarL/FixJ family response regulator
MPDKAPLPMRSEVARKSSRKRKRSSGRGGARGDPAAAPLRFGVAARPALIREALSCAVSAEPGFQFVGDASDENGIRDLLRNRKPRVLLFDFEALGPNAEVMIARLRKEAPATRFLVLATRSGPETVERVLRAGASGLVGKELDLETVFRAIRSVAGGEVWANRLVTAQALEYLSGLSEFGVARTSPVNGHLTRREGEIVHEVGLGLRNKEIAAKLRISEKTVHTHLNNIFRKLQMGNRIALALFARELIQRP